MTATVRPVKPRNSVLVLVWAVGLFLLMELLFIVPALGVSLITGEGSDVIMTLQSEESASIALHGLLSLLMAILVYPLILRYLWRRDMDWLKLSPAPQALISGFLLGVFHPCLIMFILYLLGVTDVKIAVTVATLWDFLTAFPGFLAFFLVAGFLEEVIFRGILLREWASSFGWPLAVTISGILFGLMHVMNLGDLSLPMFLWLGTGGLAISILISVLYIRSETLWMPTGFHAGWNFALTVLLGATVSGLTTNFGLLSISLRGPLALTGGRFGLELSSVTLFIVLITSAIILRPKGIGSFGLTGILQPKRPAPPGPPPLLPAVMTDPESEEGSIVDGVDL